MDKEQSPGSRAPGKSLIAALEGSSCIDPELPVVLYMHQLATRARAFDSVIMHPGSSPDPYFYLFPVDLATYYYKVIIEQRLQACFV